MGNTFGNAKLQFPLVDPRCIREDRVRFRRDLFPELYLANSWYTSTTWPGVGWILLDRGSYNQLSPYDTSLSLTIQDFVNPPLTLSNLTVVQARCVTRGLVSDPNAIYLIQITSTEGILYNPWFQMPVNAQYNVRAPAYDTQFYSTTTNSGTPWTWDGMVGNLWGMAPSQLGAYPGLPITPAGTPENFTFVGVSLWEAIAHIMAYLGLVITGEHPNYGIVVAGAADKVFTNLQSQYAKYLEDDMEYIDSGSGRVPGQVIVYFRKRYQIYGVEETVRDDSFQWQSVPLYSVTIAAPSAFTGAAGIAYIQVDFTVRYDQDGNPLAADVTTAATIAAERVAQFYNTIYRGTAGSMRQIYSGVIPFTTGSLVDGVRWFNTGMLGSNPDGYSGWRTEIIRGYAWPEVTFPLNLKGLTGPT